jgi:hypothetical protein
MMEGTFSTPRPVPGRLGPALAGATVILLGLPVFAVAGFPLAGWLLAATLFAAGQVLWLALSRVVQKPGSTAAAGAAGIGMSFRAMAVGIPLVVVTATNVSVGLSAALLYAFAYTLELTVALLAYFSAAQRPSPQVSGGSDAA